MSDLPWSHAPDCSNYAAMDSNKKWYWYDEEPTNFNRGSNWGIQGGPGGGDMSGSFDHPPVDDWRKSLQQRPAKTKQPLIGEEWYLRLPGDVELHCSTIINITEKVVKIAAVREKVYKISDVEFVEKVDSD